jgi:hypothetical protein
MQFSPISCHLIPLRSKYSPQHPVLTHSVYVRLLVSEKGTRINRRKSAYIMKQLERSERMTESPDRNAEDVGEIRRTDGGNIFNFYRN